jgi:acetyltransferase
MNTPQFRSVLGGFFRPRSVAVVGASDREGSVGRQVFENLLSAGFDGAIYPINHRHASVLGHATYARVCDVPGAIDLCVVAVPKQGVRAVLGDCIAKGVQFVLVMSAGFGEQGPEGLALQNELIEVARAHQVRIIGPNCLGLLIPTLGLNASFSKATPSPGHLALVSQSGALCTAILDWAELTRVGFSAVVSLGNAADVEFGELLDELALDVHTKSILLYIEGLHDARRFLSGLRAAARMKPVVILKAGRHAAAIAAASSHSGALASADDVFDAALARAGAVRAHSIGQLFAVAELLASGRRLEGAGLDGEGLAIVTNAGGPAVMACDRAADLQLELANIGEGSRGRLREALPAAAVVRNPIDILGDATPERYRAALEIVGSDPAVKATLALLTPQAMTNPTEVAASIASSASSSSAVMLACLMGGQQVLAGRQLLHERHVPQFNTPEAAIEALSCLDQFRRNQQLLLQLPGPATFGIEPDLSLARSIVSRAIELEQPWLDAPQTRALLGAFHIPVLPLVLASSVEHALQAAQQMGYPVALKISALGIVHKTEVGGVLLDIGSDAALRTGFEQLRERALAHVSAEQFAGVIVEPMCRRSHGRELLLGVFTDPTFGPVLTFGAGGVEVELLRDRAVELPPLSHELARSLVQRTAIARRLAAYRGKPAADLQAVCDVLVRLSELVCALPEVVELDINPLIADPSGVVALDARVRVRQSTGLGARHDHLALSPYPHELVKRVQVKETRVTLRPIRPEDAEMEAKFVKTLAPDARYHRFMLTIRELSPALLARLTQIDYDREMAFVATVETAAGELEIGVARYHTNPDGVSCEFAIVVADEWLGKGIGRSLMRELMQRAAARGLQTMRGTVMLDNHAMVAFVKSLGFSVARSSTLDEFVASRELSDFLPS